MSMNERIEQWKTSVRRHYISAVKSLEKHPKNLEDAFYTEIAFDAGGMGVMGPGTNRINQYTLGKVKDSQLRIKQNQ